MYYFTLLLLVLCCPLGLESKYHFEPGPVPITDQKNQFQCPGKARMYCGRMPLNDSHWSGCGACDRGWRVLPIQPPNTKVHSLCQQCDADPDLYDWLFFGFHALFVLVFHWAAIDHRRRQLNWRMCMVHLCALLEVACASLSTLLLSDPAGELRVRVCKVDRLSDWYSCFFNPFPNYEQTVYCSQEIPWPRFSIVLLFYFLCAAFMMLLRPLIASKLLLPGRGRNAIYRALYFLPFMGLIHAIGAGLVYSWYPFIVLILSVVSSASHFAFKLDQSMRALLLGCVKDRRNFVILIGHWLLHAFGIIAMTQVTMPEVHLSLLALVPLPAIFYILTAKYTDPNNFTVDINS